MFVVGPLPLRRLLLPLVWHQRFDEQGCTRYCVRLLQMMVLGWQPVTVAVIQMDRTDWTQGLIDDGLRTQEFAKQRMQVYGIQMRILGYLFQESMLPNLECCIHWAKRR
jgi:hypothetical protein